MAGKGIQKELHCSEELKAVTGERKLSRPQAMKEVWKYIKKHDLQGAKDDKGKTSRQWIAPDKKLASVVGSKPISMFKLAGKIFTHLS